MNHTPQHAAGHAGDRTSDPTTGNGTPTTIWHTPGADPRAQISERLAYRLIASYTEPGDTVVDLTDGAALTDAATAGGRIHIQAEFIDACVVITAISDPDPASRRRMRLWHSRPGAEPPTLREWFGDDLRDATDRPLGTTPAGTSTEKFRPARPVLLVAPWPLGDVLGGERLSALVTAAEAILRPGGCLIFVAVVDRTQTGDYTALITAARRAGLRYLQHIVAVDADIDGDRLVYHASDVDLAELGSVGHTRIHADLIVLITPGGGRHA